MFVSMSPLIHALEAFDVDKKTLTIDEEIAMTKTLSDLLKKLASLYQSVSKTPEDAPVESGELLLKGMLTVQQGLRGCIKSAESARMKKKGSLQFQVFSMIWIYQLKQCHKAAGKIRVFILEHEADLSRLSGDGPFNSADDLTKSFRS